MPKTLFLSLLVLLFFTPFAARADKSDDVIYGTGRDASSLYGGDDDQTPGFSRHENDDRLNDNRDRNEARRHDDHELRNGFGGTGSRSLGSSILDQLQPSSGR
jgi:hypothetical protein